MLLHDLLARRAAADGPGPFLTHYAAVPTPGDEPEERVVAPDRTELSARSFANWVAKTANLIVDEAGLDPGDRVEIRLNRQHPAHWMTMVWTMAAWQAGLTVTDADGDLVVDGPQPERAPASGRPAYACSLHPLGMGLKNLPGGWADFSSAALAQPDAWFGDGPASPEDVAWDVDGRRLTFAALTAVAPSSRRRLIADPADPWAAAEACLAAPLLGGGSSVVAVALDETALARVATDEKVDP